MFKVKAVDPLGRPKMFVCGTAEQALVRAEELVGRGYGDIVVTDPRGTEHRLAAFKRFVEQG
ncbi:hypothetical protein ACIKT0_00640 [Hansschlegelia beijingensis]|uniref:hypothetical protein n=1 Tax=Hansschlegelia beijingensis TaxID=1133344 RepID=UPI00387F2E62